MLSRTPLLRTAEVDFVDFECNFSSAERRNEVVVVASKKGVVGSYKPHSVNECKYLVTGNLSSISRTKGISFDDFLVVFIFLSTLSTSVLYPQSMDHLRENIQTISMLMSSYT